MFAYLTNVESLDLTNLDTSSVTNMSNMFHYVGYNANRILDLSGWNVDKVTSYYNFNYGVTSKVTSPNWLN